MADVFTSVGEGLTADYFDGTASAPANWYVAWGTGTNTAAKGDTALQTESAESRVAATEAQPSADQNEFTATMTSASGQSISEVGLFDASTVGNMPFRSDFTPVVLGIGDKIDFTLTNTWS